MKECWTLKTYLLEIKNLDLQSYLKLQYLKIQNIIILMIHISKRRHQRSFQRVLFSPVALGGDKSPLLLHMSITPPSTPAPGWATSTPQTDSWHDGTDAGESDWRVVCPRRLRK